MFDLLSDIVGSSHVRKNEPLSRHTSFQIGGPCDYFVLPHTAEEIQQLIRLCQKSNIPFLYWETAPICWSAMQAFAEW